MGLNFPVIPRAAADAMRANRRAAELMMLPVDWSDDRMPERAITQIKWDGIHTGYRRDRLWPFTREGNDMTCTAHLMPGLVALAVTLKAMFGGEHVLFGEYAHPDGFEATLGDFRRGSGSGVIQVFDAVPVAAYEGRETSPPLQERLLRLRRAHLRIQAGDLGLVMVAKSSLFEGDARENIIAMMPQLWAQGLEGIVVKDADSPYVRGPSPFWQRVKQRNTLDLRIVAVDAPGGRLKALVVDHRGTRVRVGVGFSEAQRAAPADFRPGMIVELRHLGATAAGSLRSPSFHRIRHDKES